MAEKPEVERCRVCGQLGCTLCEYTLCCIGQAAESDKEENKRVAKFREQVRNQSRKFKRSQLL